MPNKGHDFLEALQSPLVIIEDKVFEVLAELLRTARPSALEIADAIEERLGIKARWDTIGAVERLIADDSQTTSLRRYLADLHERGELIDALGGRTYRDHAAHSGIDALLRQSKAYRESSEFSELIQFIAKFRDYSPFNNLLVHMQNPACSYFATESHWKNQFHREIKEDARPLVILAPRTPILLVYDVDQTEGQPLPAELENFASFEGVWNPDLLVRLVENAARHFSIRVGFKELSSTLAGFATVERDKAKNKMRIAIHNGLDQPSQFGVLCHEIGHILLGHRDERRRCERSLSRVA